MQGLSYISFVAMLCSLFLIPSHGNKTNNAAWQKGGATWGACGFTDTVSKPPLSKMIVAGGSTHFKNGIGCGACFEVKCSEHKDCSGKVVKVMVTDLCPGGFAGGIHLDLSGTAFGALAKPGKAQQLRNAGELKILYKRVACSFGKSIHFTVDAGSNPYYFATAIEYYNADGNLVQIELKQANTNKWIPMKHSWGAKWALDLGSKLQPPFSLKLTQDGKIKKKSIVAHNVIPIQWKPGHVYRSVNNF
ncbi:hypothetical protein ACSQ67_025067 [Phaseolus vulgaris]